MSKYTTELRFICEVESGLKNSTGQSAIAHVIENAMPKIFNFTFPIFDEAYRIVLERKILYHYYTREIGLETYGLWKLKLLTKLNEIMPFYNKLYQSELLEFNPFYDVNLTRTSNREFNGDTTSNGETNLTDNAETTTVPNLTTTNTTTNTNRFSDTPQGSLSNIENNTYLTSATIDNGSSTNIQSGTNVVNSSDTQNSTNSNNTTVKNLDDYIETVIGKQGSTDYSTLLLKFRETFLNIDMMVLNELDDLFMKIW